MLTSFSCALYNKSICHIRASQILHVLRPSNLLQDPTAHRRTELPLLRGDHGGVVDARRPGRD